MLHNLNLRFAAFDFKDQLSLNCELSRWGAAINITLLHMANISVNYSDIYMTDPDCFGKIVGDKLLFNQLYDECGSTKNVCFFLILNLLFIVKRISTVILQPLNVHKLTLIDLKQLTN